MRTLWILLIHFLACGSLEAQLSKMDSSVILLYSSGGITARLNTNIGKNLSDTDFFLVKFRDAMHARQCACVVRQLTNEHFIVRLDQDDKLEDIIPKLEYLYRSNDQWKLPTGISLQELNKGFKRIVVVSLDTMGLINLLKQVNGRIIERYNSRKAYVVELATPGDAIVLLQSPVIIFIHPLTAAPNEELLINGFDLGTNRVNLSHRKFPLINGAGLVAAIKENKFDTADIDFKGRYMSTGASSTVVTGHASIMATMVAGAGNSYHLGKGVARSAGLSSTNFAQLFPAPDDFYRQYHISVENHSYGTAIENFYGADAAAYDASVISNPWLVHVFSSGNSGTAASIAGTYSGISNFANLTGSFKMAKNIITVGATDSFNNVELLSSRGPSFDGRIKPELVAFGQDGSSGAAALVSGTAILIQQAFKTQHHDSLPSAALVKAALINAADEVGKVGPDFTSGFGSLNTANAVASIMASKYVEASVADTGTYIVPIVIPTGTHQFKVTMAYSDPPAAANDLKSLVNDLDLEVVETSSGQSWKPWTLNAAPNKDSLLLPATRNRDSVNNVEQVSIDNPTAGNYELRIFGRKIKNASQDFAIVYKLDTINFFEWNYPTKNDPVLAGVQVARWNSTYGGNGSIEFSGNDGVTWQAIGTADLGKKYFKWNVPDSFHRGILRMTINGNSYLSDTFVISQPVHLNVGFNCTDSVLLTWNRIENADQYRVYGLTSNVLQPVGLTMDTAFIFSKADINTKHFTIAPLRRSTEGIKAFTVNYETQGVGCYLKEFLAVLNGNKAEISLVLGSTYNLWQIEIQKENGSAFASFQTISNPNQLSYSIENSNLHPGLNRFRAKLTLNNGAMFHSNEEIVYYLGSQDFIFYPNPTAPGKGFNVLRRNLDDASLILYDIYGKKVSQFLMQDLVNFVPTSSLQRGLYFAVVIEKNGKRIFTQKMVIQ